MQSIRYAGVIAVVSAALLAGGCTRTINRTAERKIRDALPGYIGPARQWRAHVDNPPLDTLHGKLSRVTIDGDDVQLRQTIVCDELHIELRDVQLDRNRQRLRSVGSTTFTAVIGEGSLNDYLKRFPPPKDDPVRVQSVAVRQGSLQMQATRWLLGRAWPFTATAAPRLVSPTKLSYDPQRMTVVGLPVPLPPSALGFLARYVEHGFDFSTLPFPVRISRFEAENGRVVIEGTADVMQSLNERI